MPVGDVFWVGANYYWEFEDDAPTPDGLAFNVSELDTMLSVGYEVVDHSAAIRPVVKDRRPVLGWSNAWPEIGIFNGMGSKGALMTPFWAEHFTRHILEHTPIDPEVNITRFTPK